MKVICQQPMKKNLKFCFRPSVCKNQPVIIIQLNLSKDIRIVTSGGEKRMQIEIKMDPSCTEPKVIITTASITEEVSQLMKRLSEESPSIIAGFRDDKLEILNQTELIRIYANAGKVFAVTGNGEYCVRSRLYELEERLDGSRFVRISNSEIINLNMVEHFDLSFSGTICVKLSNETITYVSRRYVAKIKRILGI